MMNDPLGRGYRINIENSHRRLLTDDELNAIAENMRTRSISEAGRHVFPLIHHAALQQDVIDALVEACLTAKAFGKPGTTEEGIDVEYILDEAIAKARR